MRNCENPKALLPIYILFRATLFVSKLTPWYAIMVSPYIYVEEEEKNISHFSKALS